MQRITTVDFPAELPLTKRGEHWFARAGDKELRFSNLDKIFWPEEGYTKGDVVNYYFNVSPTMLPHVYDRPLTMKRMPDGLKGGSFYEKNAPSHAPEWLPTVPVRTSGEEKTINFVTVHDIPDILWLAQMACIEFHPLHNRGPDQKHPSYAFFDLDPMSEGIWDQVQYTASLVKVILDQLGIESYPKTSGATGMQIMIPLAKPYAYDIVRGFVGAIADMVNAADPEVTTVEWDIPKRKGRVFLDVNMNREGANIAGAYSLRPEPGATASAPFNWEELENIRPEKFTIETMFDRIAEAGDPFLPVAEGPGNDIDAAIERVDAKPRKARMIKTRN
jgi:bifunctional non-homologous end joining protein LigD